MNCTVARDLEHLGALCHCLACALYCGTLYGRSRNNVPLVSLCNVEWHLIWSVMKHCATGQLVHCTVARDMERLETLCHWSASALYLTDNCHLPHSSSLTEAIRIVTTADKNNCISTVRQSAPAILPLISPRVY